MTDVTTVGDELAGFLDTGLDLTTDGITEAERERTLAWYREHHDHGDLDLAPIARFNAAATACLGALHTRGYVA